jgi:hypothetical protein
MDSKKDSSLKDTKTGWDSPDLKLVPENTVEQDDRDTSILWDSTADLQNTSTHQGTDMREEQKTLNQLVSGGLSSVPDPELKTPVAEPRPSTTSGLQLAEQRADQSYMEAMARKRVQASRRGLKPTGDSDTNDNSEDEPSYDRFFPADFPRATPRIQLTGNAVKGGDLAKLVEATVKHSPIPQVKLRDEGSYVKWLEGVNNLLSTIGLASLTMMNKFSNFLKNSDDLTKVRTEILKAARDPKLHPKFWKAIKEIQDGFYCDLIPIGEDAYSLNCRYYAMLFMYPNLERQVITTILPSIDLLIRDSLPDYRSTPDALKIIYGTVTRRFVNENINVIDAREERLKKMSLAASADPAALAKQIRDEVEILNTASHHVLVSPVRQLMLLYNAVKRSPDHDYYRETLKKFRELDQVRKGTYAKFSQELHADYIRDIEHPDAIYRGNAAQGGTNSRQYSTPYAPPGYCFNFVKTGSCRDGDECKYRHDDPPKGGRSSNRLVPNRDRRDRKPQFKGNKKELIRAFVSALIESESEHSDPVMEDELGSQSESSEGENNTVAMSSRQPKKKQKFPKKKVTADHKGQKRGNSSQHFSNSLNSSNKVKGDAHAQPTKPHNTFQETMKNLEKKYSKVELAKIAGIFSALDLGQEVNDPVADDQSTSPGSESQ